MSTLERKSQTGKFGNATSFPRNDTIIMTLEWDRSWVATATSFVENCFDSAHVTGSDLDTTGIGEGQGSVYHRDGRDRYVPLGRKRQVHTTWTEETGYVTQGRERQVRTIGTGETGTYHKDGRDKYVPQKERHDPGAVLSSVHQCRRLHLSRQSSSTKYQENH